MDFLETIYPQTFIFIASDHINTDAVLLISLLYVFHNIRLPKSNRSAEIFDPFTRVRPCQRLPKHATSICQASQVQVPWRCYCPLCGQQSVSYVRIPKTTWTFEENTSDFDDKILPKWRKWSSTNKQVCSTALERDQWHYVPFRTIWMDSSCFQPRSCSNHFVQDRYV
jgi:hypothetical protein